MSKSGKAICRVKRPRTASGPRWTRLGFALGCAVAVFLIAVAIASGQVGNLDPRTGGAQLSSAGGPAPLPKGWVSTHDLVLRHEALPCTGPKDPINFEIFSAGPEVAGLPMAAIVRRCDTAAPAYEAPANRVTYMYGHCEIPEGETGCAPPLEVQTWPACQRNRAGYSFEGRPLPSSELPKRSGAEVVEFNFALESRVEVYAKSSTIVIFANSPELARKAVEFLTPQKKGKPPITNPADLRGAPPERLGAPSEGATEGKLQCQS